MKRALTPIALLVVILLACSLPSIPTSTQPPIHEPTDTSVLVTEVAIPSATVTEPPTLEPTSGDTPIPANVTCNELSFYLDPTLASGYDCQSIPESSEGFEVFPAHTQITLLGYPLADKFFSPQILVFPVQRFGELLPELVPGRVMELQNLLSGAPAPIFVASFSTSLPFLPGFNAAQVFFASYQVIPFANGSGIRFLTEYAQYFAPVNNTDLFYTYQGLTSDNLHWITAILPVNHPMLPADALNPPGGLSWEEFSDDYEPYITDMVNQLNSAPGNSYLPNLATLDALAASLNILP